MFLQYFEYEEGDIISTDKYLQFCKDMNKGNLKYYKTDSFYANNSYDWRGVNQQPPSQDDKSNVLIGHSDYDINENIYQRYTFRNWFCVNKNVKRDNVFAIPLGVTNNCDDSPIHRIFGNTQIFFDVLAEEKKIKNLVYLNFNISNFPSERNKVFDLFKNKSYVTHGVIDNTIEGRKNFLREIYNHKFVLCPRGNGFDTHRLWETLYMRTIPIVKREIYNEEFEDLPILFVNEWEDMSEEFLNSKYDEIMCKRWNLDKLKIGYWYEFINDHIRC